MIHRIGNPDLQLTPENVGNKAAQLHYIATTLAGHHNVQVPPAFVITQPGYSTALRKPLKYLGAELVSVRSSPSVSMPGMLETKLNVPPCHSCVNRYIREVFASMQSDRARQYMEFKKLKNVSMGVVVQKMVFGDEAGLSGSGVMFTKDPNTGANYFNGEWVPNQQGDVLVSGEVTPKNLDDMPGYIRERVHAMAYTLLDRYPYPLDIEFTVENGVVYCLQVRKLHIVPKKKEEVPEAHPGKVLLKGKVASTGVAMGYVVNTSEEALGMKNAVLVTKTTTTDDMPGMSKALAFVTGVGGYTCHAAVVARSMKKPGVVGVGAKEIGKLSPGQQVYVDGHRGTVHEV